MAKDPAVLFYTADFLSTIQGLTRQERLKINTGKRKRSKTMLASSSILVWYNKN